MSPGVRTVDGGEALPVMLRAQRRCQIGRVVEYRRMARAAAARAIDAACARSRRARCSSRFDHADASWTPNPGIALSLYSLRCRLANSGMFFADFRSTVVHSERSTDRQLRPFWMAIGSNDNQAWRVVSCADTRIADGAAARSSRSVKRYSVEARLMRAPLHAAWRARWRIQVSRARNRAASELRVALDAVNGFDYAATCCSCETGSVYAEAIPGCLSMSASMAFAISCSPMITRVAPCRIRCSTSASECARARISIAD